MIIFLSGQHKLNTKKNIIEVAKEFPTYFARLYPVTSGQNTEDMQYLAISHSGIRLVRREKSLPTDYLQVSVPLYNYLEQNILMGPWDPGPGTRDSNEGTHMLGPKYRDPNSQVWNVRVPSAGTHRPGTQMKGPIYWDPSVFRSERSEAVYGSLGWRHLMGP